MSKFFGLMAATLVAVSVQAAKADVFFDVNALQAQTLVEAQLHQGLNWHVGDQADYKIAVGGFINGTSHNFVREDIGTSFWMEQDMDIGMLGKQKIEIQINKTTGAIEKLLANGQAQTPPNAADQQVIDMHEDHVTIGMGSYDCIYAKVQSKKDQSIQEAWINPQVVPMMGLLKALADSQFGKVTQEATAFTFATK